MSFEKLLDVLEAENKKREQCPPGYMNTSIGPVRLSKSMTHETHKDTPVYRVTAINEPIEIINYRPSDMGMSNLLKSLSEFHKQFQKPKKKPASIKPTLQGLQKTARDSLSSFSRNLSKSMRAGELSADEASLLETKRNHLAQHYANLGLI